jgi:hypothetical protein
MAAQGRGPDRTLVHMSPKEVQGLQALAMAHGGSLTINPETGLPEAGFLESILPAVAGFALNAFAPGVGTAVGGMFGLGEAAGTALTVGGISGLASGSLEKGIMAGMGAYGGAGLSGSLMNSGTSALTQAGVDAAGGAAALGGDASGIAQKVADTSTLDKLKAGFGAAASTPKDFIQDNKFALGAAFLPALAGGLGDDGGAQATTRKKYNMNYVKDPVTGALYDTSGEGVTYGGVGRSTRGMADGGIIDDLVMNTVPVSDRANMIATETNAPNTQQVAYDTRTDSQKSLDYLMGKPGSTNPMLFTHEQATSPIQPADFATRTGGHYVLDAATNTYTWIPDAGTTTAGLPGLVNKDGSHDYKGVDTDWGQVLGKPELKGLTFQELTQEDQDAASAIVDPYGIGKGLAGLIQGSFLGKAATTVGNFFDSLQGKNLETGGWKTGFNEGTLGTGVSTQSQDAATNAQVELAAQANAANTIGVNDAAANAAADSARARDAAISEGMRGENQGGSYGGDFGGRDAGGGSGGGSEGRDSSHGDSSGYSGGAAKGGFYKNGKFNFHPAQAYANGGITALAGGGLGSLGGYSDGGQLLKGPGDGVSDSIPARIAGNQPARLANNEFVIPARIVSELGNGSTDAGARELYKMMARIQAGRKKSIGKGKIAVDSKAVKHLPA